MRRLSPLWCSPLMLQKRAKWGSASPCTCSLTVCQYRDHECAVYDTDHRASCLCDCDCAWNACVHRHQQHVEKEPDCVFMGITNIPMLNGEIVMGISLMLPLSSAAFSWIRYHSDGTYYVQCSLRYLERYAEIKADEQIDVRGSRSWCLSAVCILESHLPGHHAALFRAFCSFTMSLDDFVITYFTKDRALIRLP